MYCRVCMVYRLSKSGWFKARQNRKQDGLIEEKDILSFNEVLPYFVCVCVGVLLLWIDINSRFPCKMNIFRALCNLTSWGLSCVVAIFFSTTFSLFFFSLLCACFLIKKAKIHSGQTMTGAEIISHLFPHLISIFPVYIQWTVIDFSHSTYALLNSTRTESSSPFKLMHKYLNNLSSLKPWIRWFTETWVWKKKLKFHVMNRFAPREMKPLTNAWTLYTSYVATRETYKRMKSRMATRNILLMYSYYLKYMADESFLKNNYKSLTSMIMMFARDTKQWKHDEKIAPIYPLIFRLLL